MQVYQLTPPADGNRLTPQEVLDRFTAVFERVESDRGDAEPLGICVINAYKRMLSQYDELRKQNLVPDQPKPLSDVDRIWRNTIQFGWTTRRIVG